MKNHNLSFKRVLYILSYALLIIIAALFVWSFVRMAYNPMRRPAPMIRSHILRNTPLGTCMEEAIEIIESNERWGTPVISRDSGFIVQGAGIPNFPLFTIIGEQQIQTRPERYNVLLFLERGVRIFWGFDENGKLIEVFVSSAFDFRHS